MNEWLWVYLIHAGQLHRLAFFMQKLSAWDYPDGNPSSSSSQPMYIVHLWNPEIAFPWCFIQIKYLSYSQEMKFDLLQVAAYWPQLRFMLQCNPDHSDTPKLKQCTSMRAQRVGSVSIWRHGHWPKALGHKEAIQGDTPWNRRVIGTISLPDNDGVCTVIWNLMHGE